MPRSTAPPSAINTSSGVRVMAAVVPEFAAERNLEPKALWPTAVLFFMLTYIDEGIGGI